MLRYSYLFILTLVLIIPMAQAEITIGGSNSSVRLDVIDLIAPTTTSSGGGSNISSFLQLIDTPGSYAGSAGDCVAVNSSASGLEFITCSSGGGGGDFFFSNFTASFDSNLSSKTTDDLTQGTSNLYDNQSWNESYADTLYLPIDTIVGDFFFSNFTSSFNSNFSGKNTDDLTQGTTNLYDNQSWNESYADTLYLPADTVVGDFFFSNFTASFDSNLSSKTTDDLTQGTTNLYDNQSWNESYADTLYVPISTTIGDFFFSNFSSSFDTNLSAELPLENRTLSSYRNLTDLPTCPAGQVLTFDGTTMSCTTPAGDGTGGWTNNSEETNTSLIVNIHNNVSVVDGFIYIDRHNTGFARSDTVGPGSQSGLEVVRNNSGVNIGVRASPIHNARINFGDTYSNSVGQVIYRNAQDVFQFLVGGTNEMELDNAALHPVTSNGLALGTSAAVWDELYVSPPVNGEDELPILAISGTRVMQVGKGINAGVTILDRNGDTFIMNFTSGVLTACTKNGGACV